MKQILTGVAAVALAAATLGAQQTVQINGAGATFPAPDLYEVVLGVQQAAPERPDQLPAGRLGRRHQAAHEPDGVLRRLRRPDDTGPAAGGAGQVMHFPTVLGAVVPIYNMPGVSQQLKFSGTGARGHLPGQDHQVERPAIAKLNPGVNLPAMPTSPSRIARTARARRYIWCDYLAKVSPEWKQKVGIATSVQVAGRRLRRQGQRRRRRHRQPDAWRDRIRRAGVRAAEQDQLRQCAEHERQIRESLGRLGDGGGERRGREDAGRLPRVDHQRARRRRLSDLVVHLDAALPGRRRTRRRAKIMVDFMKWALTDGQKFAPTLGYAPLPEDRRRHGAQGARRRSRFSSRTRRSWTGIMKKRPVPTKSAFASGRVSSPWS